MTLPSVLVLTLTVLACPPPPAVEPPAKPTVSQRTAAIDAQTTLLAAQPRFTGRASGYGAVKSKAYEAFEKLLDVAEDSDLEGLLSAQSPVVRLYAYWGLVKRGHAPAGLLSRLSKPEEKVQTLSDVAPVSTGHLAGGKHVGFDQLTI